MKKFAKIEDNLVTNLIVANDVEFCISLYGEGFWLEVEEGGIGWQYVEKLNKVVPPQDYPSWLLNEETLRWYPPKPFPNKDLDTTYWKWEESAKDWVGYPLGG